jgi:hypothetical protein
LLHFQHDKPSTKEPGRTTRREANNATIADLLSQFNMKTTVIFTDPNENQPSGIAPAVDTIDPKSQREQNFKYWNIKFY